MTSIDFGPFTIDLNHYSLTRSGEPIRIGPKALDLLLFLIENRHRTCDRDSIQQAIWRSAALSNATIPTCILELRKALGDDARRPKYISSVRGRGYRFLPDIQIKKGRNHARALAFRKLPFVGRERELSELSRCFRTVARESRGRLVLVQGVAGAGKTRFVEEFLEQLPSRARAPIIRCASVASSLSFGPWHLLQDLLSTSSTTEERTARITNQVQSHKPKVATTQGCPAEIHLRATECIAAIRHWCGGSAGVFVLEDIHLADPLSRSLLHLASREIAFDPVIILTTLRPCREARELLGPLVDGPLEGRSIRIDLDPLGEADVQALLPPYAGDRENLSRQLTIAAAGNPFFVSHLVHHLERTADSTSIESAILSFAPDSPSIINRMLSDVNSNTRHLLTIASIVGIEFCPSLIASIADLDLQVVLRDLEPAVEAAHLRQEGPSYRFQQSLLRNALYASIPGHVRANLHYQTAEFLSSRVSAPPEPAALAAIADHFYLALPISTPRDVSSASAAAGRRAPPAEALRFFERAHSAMSNDPSASVNEKCQAASDLGRALATIGDQERSHTVLMEACRLARDHDTAETFAECALGLVTDYQEIEFGKFDLATTRIVEEAINMASDLGLAVRAHLYSALAQCLRWAGDSAAHTNAANSALDLARKSNDNRALEAALAAKAETLHGPDRTTERIRVLEELMRLATSNPSVSDQLLQHTRMLTAQLELGDMARVDAENAASRKRAEQIDLPQLLWYPESADSMRSLMQGDCSQNNQLRIRHEQIVRSNPVPNVVQGYATQEAFRQIELGNASIARPAIEELSRKNPLVLSWQAAAAWIAWACDDLNTSRAHLEAFSPKMLASMFREPGGAIGIALVAEVAASIGSNAEQRYLYKMINPVTERAATAGYGVLYAGSFSRYAGLLASSLGLHDQSIHLLEAAIEQERSRRAILWRAYAEIDLVEVMLRSGIHLNDIASRWRRASRTTRLVGLPRVSQRLQRLSSCVGNGERPQPVTICD